MREKVLLICEECLSRNYTTTVKKEGVTNLQFKKYCRSCNKMTVHKISKQQQGVYNMGIKKFTKDVVKEGKRVRWPKKDVLIPSIIVVILVAALTGLLLMGEDAIGKGLIDALMDAFRR